MNLWQEAGTSLLAASLFSAGIALFGLPLTKGRSYYIAGLAGAFIAFVIATLINIARLELPLLAYSALAPAIEEPIRVCTASAILSRTNDRGSWLAFALGYALLESSVKFGDALVTLDNDAEPTRTVAELVAPLVPLTLHVFLSVLTMRLRARNTPFLIVLAVMLLLHTVHNYSVLAPARSEVLSWLLVFEMLLRSLLFVGLTVLILRRRL